MFKKNQFSPSPSSSLQVQSSYLAFQVFQFDQLEKVFFMSFIVCLFVFLFLSEEFITKKAVLMLTGFTFPLVIYWVAEK